VVVIIVELFIRGMGVVILFEIYAIETLGREVGTMFEIFVLEAFGGCHTF